jgi:signal transduction histidine kinase
VTVAPRIVRLLAILRPSSLTARQQDGFIAVIVLVGGLLLCLADVHRLIPGTDGFGLWVRLVELAVLSGLERLRRRVPGALLLATVVLGVDIALGLSLPVVLVYADLLYTATLHASKRTSRVVIWVAAAVLLVLFGGALAVIQQWRVAVLIALACFPFVLVPVWWAANVRQQREIAESERTNAEQLARITELDRRAAVSEERARMARDLHDVISGHLSAIAIQSEGALSMAYDPAMAHDALESVRKNSVSALEEMRAMIGLLREDGNVEEDEAEITAPARLTDLTLLVDSARANGMQVTVNSSVDEALPAAVDLTAYRIAQEALTNTVKHAPNGRVDLNITLVDHTLTIEVNNDAVRPRSTSADEPGYGLLNMQERAYALGGTLSAGPVGSNWVVRADLPVAGGRA